MKVFLGLIGFTLLTEIVVEILIHKCGTCLHIPHHIYTPVEYCFYAWIFSTWLPGPVLRKLLRISMPIFILFAFLYSAFFIDMHSLNVLTGSVASIIYVMLSAYVLLGLFSEREKSVLKLFRFWVSAPLLIYSAGTIVYFALHELVVADYLMQIWLIHAILNIASYCGYAVGFTCKEV